MGGNNMLYKSADADIYLIYLRKSRADNPEESVEEVLAKHETQLQEWARQELGYEIPEDYIYREVVSGESIDDRVEIQKVLARIEDPAVKGVIVIEPQRLSRGDLEDCGRLINVLKFTNTQVCTPMMTYDLNRKMERKFFQDELLRGRDFLEYTKEILLRGRVAAIKRGCFIGQRAPYGYNKIKIGDDCTLEPNENADVVRLIFDSYVEEGMTPFQIAQRLNSMKVPAPRGQEWKKDTIRTIIRNDHYVGKVHYNKVQKTTVIEHGERVTKRLHQPDDVVITAEGKHPALITLETWKAAQELVARNPRVKHEYELKNPFSSMIFCAKCGKALYIHPYKNAEERFECRTRPLCYKSVKYSELYDAIIAALEEAELPALQMKVKNGDGNARKIQERQLAKLEAQMAEYRDQEETQYELLETKKYTQELFDRRNGALRAKMDKCQKEIYEAKSSMPSSVNYEEKIVALQDAIAALRDPDATPRDKNRVLKAIVDRIEYTGSQSFGPDKKRRINYNPFTVSVKLRF